MPTLPYEVRRGENGGLQLHGYQGCGQLWSAYNKMQNKDFDQSVREFVAPSIDPDVRSDEMYALARNRGRTAEQRGLSGSNASGYKRLFLHTKEIRSDRDRVVLEGQLPNGIHYPLHFITEMACKRSEAGWANKRMKDMRRRPTALSHQLRHYDYYQPRKQRNTSKRRLGRGHWSEREQRDEPTIVGSASSAIADADEEASSSRRPPEAMPVTTTSPDVLNQRRERWESAQRKGIVGPEATPTTKTWADVLTPHLSKQSWEHNPWTNQ